MIVKNAWYVAAWAHEVTTSPIARRICNDPIVLFRTEDGVAAALLDACSHRAAPLSKGTVVPCGIRCNYHGLVFNEAGVCVAIPGQSVISPKARVRSYPLVEKNRVLWIWMGEAEQADPADILDYPFHDDAQNWPTRFEMAPVKADYLLLIDNLLDATHLAYVHAGSVGGGAPDVHFHAEMKTHREPNGVRYERTMRNSPAPPVYRACVPFDGPIDRWQEIAFTAPAAVLQYSGGVETGEDQGAGVKRRFAMRILHAITPETDTSSLYFWSASNGYAPGDLTATDKIVDEMTKVIAEDKVMVEAQQERIRELGENWLVDNRADTVRGMMRQTIRHLAAAEAA